MPQSGDRPVPPLVRHRKPGASHAVGRRGAGVHRAAGLSGPTRRYAVIVVMLVTMSSLPIIAAIGTGSANVGESVASGTTPFIAPPSAGPVVVPPPPPLAIPAEPPVPAGVAEQLRAVEPKREPRARRPVRKTKRAVRPTESAPVRTPPVKPTEPVRPTRPPASPSPSPSLPPSPTPPITPRPSFPASPAVPAPPSASQSIVPSVAPPTAPPSCWPDLALATPGSLPGLWLAPTNQSNQALDACLSDQGVSVRP